MKRNITFKGEVENVALFNLEYVAIMVDKSFRCLFTKILKIVVDSGIYVGRTWRVKRTTCS